MEHVVQFGINIDDDRIVQAVVNEATKQIITELKDQMFVRSYYDNKYHDLSKAACNTIQDWLEDHKDEIIDKTVAELVDILKNRKAFKDKLAEAEV
jgi:hypothetical protein